MLYEAAEHGGDLVYKYAGGVGIRSGDTADVRRLLVAGLYHSVATDRAQGRREEAARLVTELVRRVPHDLGVKLLGVESLLEDRQDARAALEALQRDFPNNARITERLERLR